MKLVLVTASTDPNRARPCIRSWGGHPFVGVINGRPWTPPEKPTGEAEGPLVRSWLYSPEYLGTVPAFRLGVDYALEQTDADVIACLHDDVEILQADWAEQVLRHFDRYPACGLLGFGGAIGLGSDDLYQTPYNPMQLARIGFRSNLVDAEVHGMRSLLPERVACLDSFSMIGRREFWLGLAGRLEIADGAAQTIGDYDSDLRPWTVLENLGVRHHFHDGGICALARRYHWDVWYLPIRCRHFGGMTAVGDRGYHAWAEHQIPLGDQGFWQQAHKICYDHFKKELPIRV